MLVRQLTCVLVLAVLASGCAGKPEQKTGVTAYAPVATFKTALPTVPAGLPTVPVAQAPPAFTLSAQAFYDDYTRNPNESRKKYAGKVVELTGTVKTVGTNTNGQPILYLAVTGDFLGVLCIFSHFDGKLSEAVAAGQAVKVKGVWPVDTSRGCLSECVLAGR